MKFSRKLWIVLGTAVLFALPGVAATEVSHTKEKDESVRAEYSWIEGCVSKHLEIWASRTRVKEDGSPDTQTISYINFSTYTFCDLSNTQQTFYHGVSTTASVNIDSNLRWASVQSSSFPVSVISADTTGNVVYGPEINLVVNVQWISDDQVDKISGAIVTTYPGFHSVSQLTGHYRLGIAGGVISDGTQNLMPTAANSAFAEIYKLTGGDTTLIKD